MTETTKCRKSADMITRCVLPPHGAHRLCKAPDGRGFEGTSDILLTEEMDHTPDEGSFAGNLR
jgi:hypothetical protein